MAWRLSCSSTGGEALHEHLAAAYNAMFVQGKVLPELCDGVLIALNKPGKPRVVSQTRPITLLTVMRKILSLVALARTHPFLREFIPADQCAFTPGRSAPEIIFCYRVLAGVAEKFNRELQVFGIDMSKAFDTVDRQKLLSFLKSRLPSATYRIIRVLLSSTTLRPRVGGKLASASFLTYMGTFQGDGISPALFIIYVEMASAYLWEHGVLPPHSSFPLRMETKYADDWDFVYEDPGDAVALERDLQSVLSHFNLKENPTKREQNATRLCAGAPSASMRRSSAV